MDDELRARLTEAGRRWSQSPWLATGPEDDPEAQWRCARTVALDGDTVVVAPPSTFRGGSGTIKRWWHPEGCPVLAGRCTCRPHEQDRRR